MGRALLHRAGSARRLASTRRSTRSAHCNLCMPTIYTHPLPGAHWRGDRLICSHIRTTRGALMPDSRTWVERANPSPGRDQKRRRTPILYSCDLARRQRCRRRRAEHGLPPRTSTPICGSCPRIERDDRVHGKLTWKAKYGSIVAGVYDLLSTDGMNEEGPGRAHPVAGRVEVRRPR